MHNIMNTKSLDYESGQPSDLYRPRSLGYLYIVLLVEIRHAPAASCIILNKLPG